MNRAKRLGVALLSAPLLAAAQSPISLGPLALVALVPWLTATRRGGRGEALATGALVGTAYGCLVAPWGPEALRSLGSSGPAALAGLVVTAAWAKLPLFAGLGWLVWRLRDRPAPLQIAGVAMAFGAGDWWLGTWSLGVPVALLGQSQLATLGVAQLAVVGGVALLSAGVAALNQAIALALAGVRPARPIAAVLAGAWIATALLGLPIARAVRPAPPTDEKIALLIVQPDLSHRDRWTPRLQLDNLQRVASYTDRALAANRQEVRAIVWPENLLTSPVDVYPALLGELQRWVDRWRVPVITGLMRSASGARPHSYRSSVLWVEPGQGVTAAMDKARAIPVLESNRTLPGSRLLASLFGRAARWPKLEETTAVGPLRGDFTVTPALCWEVLFPGLVARRRSPESLAILNLADDSWVAGETVTGQLTDIATFRAIEQRLTLIRVAHGGLSVVVDPFGRRLETLPRDAFAHARVEIRPSPPPTLGEQAALGALPLASGLGVWWLGGAWTRRRAARGPSDGGRTREA